MAPTRVRQIKKKRGSTRPKSVTDKCQQYFSTKWCTPIPYLPLDSSALSSSPSCMSLKPKWRVGNKATLTYTSTIRAFVSFYSSPNSSSPSTCSHFKTKLLTFYLMRRKRLFPLSGKRTNSNNRMY